MNKKVFYQAIEDSFKKYLSSSFELHNKEYAYKKTGDDIWGMTWVDYTRHNMRNEPGFELDPVFFYVSGAIENIYVNGSRKSKKVLLENRTVSNFWREIIINPDGIYKRKNNFEYRKDFECYNLDDVDRVIEKFSLLITTEFAEYASKFDTVGKIDALYNTNTSDYLVYHVSQIRAKAKGLIAAKLNNNPQYDSLVSLYKKQILSMAWHNNPLQKAEVINALKAINVDTSDMQ